MSDEEFDVLDELYFIISYDELMERLDIERAALQKVLSVLRDKEWLRVYSKLEEEVTDADLENNGESYFYLASKKGLMAHNRQ